MPLSLAVSNSGRLGRLINAACTSCRWSVCIASVGAGFVLMALSAELFGDGLLMAWSTSWIAGLVELLVFIPMPAVLFLLVRDFRDSRDQANLLERWTRSGLSATCMGVLLFILALASWGLMTVVAS
jgi:hypothetical protein